MARVHPWRCADRRSGSTPPARRGRHAAKELASTRNGDCVSSPRGGRAAPTPPPAGAATRSPRPLLAARQASRQDAPRAPREGSVSSTRPVLPTTQSSPIAATALNRLRSSQTLGGATHPARYEMFPPGYGERRPRRRPPAARWPRRQRTGPSPRPAPAGQEHRGEVERGGGVELAPAIRFQLYHLVARIEENSVGYVIAKASAVAVGRRPRIQGRSRRCSGAVFLQRSPAKGGYLSRRSHSRPDRAIAWITGQGGGARAKKRVVL